MLITLEQLKTSLEATLKEVDKKASQEDIELYEQKLEDCENDLTSHINDKSNPHSVNLSQLGVSATPTELDYMKGVTSKVQTQLNNLNTAINTNKNNISSANTAINTNKNNITTLTTNLNNEVTRAKGVEAALEEDVQTADALIHKLSDPLVNNNYATVLNDSDDALIRNMVVNGKTTQKEGVEVEVENDLLGLEENFSHQYAYEKAIEKVNGGGTLEVSCGQIDSAYGLSMSFYYDDYQVGNSIELMNNSTQTVYLPPSSGINKIKIDNTYSTPVPWGVQNLKVIDINNRFITKIEGVSPDYPQEIVSTDKIDIKLCGKNLLGGDAFADAIISISKDMSVKDETNKTVNLTASYAKDSDILKGVFKENTQYTLVIDGYNANSQQTNVCFQYTDGSNSDQIKFSKTNEREVLFYTSPANKSISHFRGIFMSGITTFYYENCGIFEGVITPEEYEAYKEQVVSYDLPMPLQSGQAGITFDYLDLNKGKLIQNIKTIRLMSNMQYNTGNNMNNPDWKYFYTKPADMDQRLYLDDIFYCNVAINGKAYEVKDLSDVCGLVLGQIRIMLKDYQTLDSFKEYIDNHECYVSYPLAQPIEHDLPNDLLVQLRALHTYNNTTNIISNVPIKFNYKLNLETWSALSSKEKLKTINNDTEMLVEMISGIIGKDDTPEVDLTGVNEHMENNNIHVTLEDKKRWDNAAAGDVTVDNALSDTSINPVQNKVVTEAISSQDAKFISINSQIEDLQERDNLIQQAIDGLVDNNTTYALECPSMQTDAAVKVNLVPSTGTGTSISLIGSGGTSVYSNSSGSIVVSTDLTSLGITASADELNYVDGVTGNIQTQLDNKASNAHGTHVEFSTADPIMAGIADAGSATTVSRSDHVHPAQVNVAGNAGTATKLASAANINGMSFDGFNNVESFGTLNITSTTITVTGTSLGTGTPAEGWQFITRFTSDYTNTTASIIIGNSTISKTVRYRNSTTLPKNLFKANTIYSFVYTGSYWDVVGIYPQVGCDFASNDFAPVTVQQLNSSNPGVGVGFKQDASNYYGYIGMSELDGKLHRHLSSNKTTYYTVHDTTTIQSGSVQVPLSGSAAPYKGSVNVTFTNAFSSIPNVVLTPVGSTPEDLKGLTVSNISTSGFTINIAKGSNFATTVQWMACGGY